MTSSNMRSCLTDINCNTSTYVQLNPLKWDSLRETVGRDGTVIFLLESVGRTVRSYFPTNFHLSGFDCTGITST